MSYRYRVSGYRSQPVSNRSSLYLPSDFNVTNYSEDLSDFDRQFKKLMERTEKFTNRVEKLQNTSSHIKKGFRKLDSTVTGLRSQREVIGSTFDNIESRLYSDLGEPPTTEEEWKKFLDAGILIEKAVELLRSRYRHPKAAFEYSPPERSPYSFDISSSTSLVSNPHSPLDKEGNRIKDLGSELRSIDGTINDDNVAESTSNKNKNKSNDNAVTRVKALPVLSEELDEPTESEQTNGKLQRGETSKNMKPSDVGTTDKTSSDVKDEKAVNRFRSSKIFQEDGENGELSTSSRSKFTIGGEEEDDEMGDKTTGVRRQSFIRTLIANKRKNRPTSMFEKNNKEDVSDEPAVQKSNITENEEQKSRYRHRKSNNDNDVPTRRIRRNERYAVSDAEEIDSRRRQLRAKSLYADLDNIADDTSFQSSTNSSLNSSYSRVQDDKSSNTNSLKKRSSSSSFHEYAAGNRVPLKERLRMKREAENANKPNENEEEEEQKITISSNSEIAQRASRFLHKAKEKEKEREKEKEKEESTSFKSRFFKRFRQNKNDTQETRKEKEREESESRRRRTRRRSNDEDAGQVEVIREQRQIEPEKTNRKSRNSWGPKSETSSRIPSSSTTNSSIHSRSSSRSTTKEENQAKLRREDDDVFQKSPRKFSDITCSLKDINTQATDATTANGIDSKLKDDQLEIKHESFLERRRRSRQISIDRAKSFENRYEAVSEVGLSLHDTDKVKNVNITLAADKPNDTDGCDIKTDVVLRRKNLDPTEESVHNLNRKSIVIYEDEIVPVQTKREKMILAFKSPQRSKEEVDEGEITISMSNESQLPENLFDALLEDQRTVSEEDIPVVQVSKAYSIDEAIFDRVYQISPPKDINTTFFNEESSNVCTPSSMEQGDTRSAKLKLAYETEIQMSKEEKRSSLDDILEEFDKINNEMYDNLLDLAKTPVKEESEDKASSFLPQTDNEINKSLIDNDATVSFVKADQEHAKNIELLQATNDPNIGINEAISNNLIKSDTNSELEQQLEVGEQIPRSVIKAPIQSGLSIDSAAHDDSHLKREAMVDNDHNGTRTTRVASLPFNSLYPGNQSHRQHETMLDIKDAGLLTLAKYVGRNVEEIAGTVVEEKPETCEKINVIESELINNDESKVEHIENKNESIERTVNGESILTVTDVTDAEKIFERETLFVPVDIAITNSESNVAVNVNENINDNAIGADPSTNHPKNVDTNEGTEGMDNSANKNTACVDNGAKKVRECRSSDTENKIENMTIVSSAPFGLKITTSSSDIASDKTVFIQTPPPPIETVTVENKPMDTLTKVPLHVVSPLVSGLREATVKQSPRKRLSYREKREAHMKLLHGRNNISDSLTSLTDVDLEPITRSNVSDSDTNDPSGVETTADISDRIKTTDALPDISVTTHEEVPNDERMLAKNEAVSPHECSNDNQIQTKFSTENNASILHEDHVESIVTTEETIVTEYKMDRKEEQLTAVDRLMNNDTTNIDVKAEQAPVLESQIELAKVPEKTHEQRDTETPSYVTSSSCDESNGQEPNFVVIQNELNDAMLCQNRMNDASPILQEINSEASTDSTRPILVKQMSIKEYRKKKLESQGTSDTSCSEESNIEKSDFDKNVVSSQADVSDISEDNRNRNKRYSHSRKDLQNIGRTSDSSSESDASSNAVFSQLNQQFMDISLYRNTETLSEPNAKNYSAGSSRRYSNGDTIPNSDRRKRYAKKTTHKSVDYF